MGLKDGKIATHRVKIKPTIEETSWYRANQEFDVIDSADLGFASWNEWIALETKPGSSDCIKKKDVIIIQKYIIMSDKLEITVGQVKRAAEEHPNSAKLLETLFPDAFKLSSDVLLGMLPTKPNGDSTVTVCQDGKGRAAFYFSCYSGYKWEISDNGKTGGIFVTPIKK